MCPVIISTHISKMLSTAESQRPWRAKTGLSVHEGAGGRRDFERFFLRSAGPQCGCLLYTSPSPRYSAAKAAVQNLSASMAAEFAAANIRVLAYVPGMIATEIAAESIEKYGDALLADIPCRRFGTPEDLGKVLVFLASDAAGYMNGCHVEISGGKRCVQNPQFSYQ